MASHEPQHLLSCKYLLQTIVAVLTLLSSAAYAHKASDAYLLVSDTPQTGLAGAGGFAASLKLSLALRDIDAAVNQLDGDNDRKLTWGEIRTAMPLVLDWVDQGIALRCANQALVSAWQFESLEERSDGVYARLAASASCNAETTLSLNYKLMHGIDPTHRLLIGGSLGGKDIASVISPEQAVPVVLHGGVLHSETSNSGWNAFSKFFPQGIHHIATGYDHLAFLLALLLPLQLRAGTQRKAGLLGLLRTVTGFTLGHSLTLALAAWGLIGAPFWVEPAIAITIAVSALLNIYPQRWLRGDALALGFGLVHGLGFSSVMQEAAVSQSLLPWALGGFNLGVEAGQLVFVAVWCVLHLALVQWTHYERTVVKGGSWCLVVLALYWTGQRLGL